MPERSYFTDAELACRHCGAQRMDVWFMREVNELRHRFGKPLHVTSAYRCPDHNEAVSSTGRNGPHTTGRAIDLAVQGEDAYRLVKLAIGLGFTGIGIQQKGSGRFVHLDNLPGTDYPRPRIWSY